jgi:NADH-quinone oxidoreductase subunit N
MTGDMILAILPEIGVLVLAGVVLVVDMFLSKEKGRVLGWITLVGLLLIVIISLLLSQPPVEPQLIWGGMLRADSIGFVFRLIFLSGAALTTLFVMENPEVGQRGEFYILLLVSTLGMSLMAASADLIMLYLAIETTSIPLYVMAGFVTRDQKSVESGMKYLLFGAMTSAVMLYGFSLLYGFTGATQIYDLAALLRTGDLPVISVMIAALLILAGFSFKISAVPFHFWAPDVYEGAPTPVAGFLSTASKAAGFIVLLRVLLGVFPDMLAYWSLAIGIMAAASMFVGNFLALAQKNIKRLLAYSSIAQAGYILIGVAAGSQLGSAGATYYLMAYLLTNLAAFGVVTVVGRRLGSDDIAAYAGLSRRSPGLALVMLAALLSLGGIPPFAGFIGKLLVLAAAVEVNMVWLALIGVINSIIALYYYLNVLKVIYVGRTDGDEQALSFDRTWTAALWVCAVGVIVLGTIIAPWYGWSVGAAQTLFIH